MIGDKAIVILDTSVNHLPEVFEFQFRPEIEGGDSDGSYEYTIAGSSCLAGDVFGQYSFNSPLQIGSRVVFPNVGAYSMVKANMFNGLNLPTVYHWTSRGNLVMKQRFGYEDFANRYGVKKNVLV